MHRITPRVGNDDVVRPAILEIDVVRSGGRDRDQPEVREL